jgi:hypothetical protein
VDVASPREPVVHDHDCHYRRDEAQIRAEEGKEVLGAVHQEPWDDRPYEDVTEDHAADNGEVLWKQAVEVTADGDGVARDVCDDRGETLDEGSEENKCAGTRAPKFIQDEAVEVPQIPVCHAEMLLIS